MKLILKIASLVVVAIIIILIVTNPSYSRFNEFIPDTSSKGHRVVLQKQRDMFIYSIYTYTTYEYHDDESSTEPAAWVLSGSHTYRGILNNFFEIQ